MDDIVKAIGTNVVNIISDAIRAGKSRKEAEDEAARALERGDVVSEEVYDRLDNYVKETRDFEKNG